MVLLVVGFSPRHVLQTANQIGESREGRFCRQIGGTVPAVSPEATSAHPFSVLRQRRGCAILLTHFTVHGEVFYTLYTVRLTHRPRGKHISHADLTCLRLSRYRYAAQLPKIFDPGSLDNGSRFSERKNFL